LYKTKLFPEPQAKLTKFAVLPGLDGRKMSKSYGNTIPVSVSPDELKKLVQKMMTDPSRKLRTDAGNPQVCPVFSYHKMLNTVDRIENISQACQSASMGCVDCKKECLEHIAAVLAPIQQKRAELTQNADYVRDVLKTGSEKARAVASTTLQEVKQVIGI
jgi:tryptophanyl-tRNA synthetase